MKKIVAAATAEIQRRWPTVPKVALVLGTGLGQFAQEIRAEVTIPFADIPGFARTTAIAHRGQLVCGAFSGKPVLLLDGRCHVYEGYSFAEVTLPIRVVRACGATTLIVTNASGGLNRNFAPSDVMVIEDHINLMGRATRSPFLGKPALHVSRSYLPQSPPLPYDASLIELALAVARRRQFVAHRGVYAAVTGPNYETRAEYSFLRGIGADAVGMSTVPEVLVAAQLGMRALGLSIVTNVAHTVNPDAVDPWKVVNAAEQAEPRVRQIVEDVIRSL